MDDLVEFMRARLAEDEEAARQAADFGGGINGHHWCVSGSHVDDGGTYWRIVATAVANSYEQVIEIVGSGMSGGGAHTEQVAHHAARHDPARVLREVEAKRGLVGQYERAVGNRRAHPDDLASAGAFLSLHGAVRLFALPYADHPDYRQEWTP